MYSAVFGRFRKSTASRGQSESSSQQLSVIFSLSESFGQILRFRIVIQNASKDQTAGLASDTRKTEAPQRRGDFGKEEEGQGREISTPRRSVFEKVSLKLKQF